MKVLWIHFHTRNWCEHPFQSAWLRSCGCHVKEEFRSLPITWSMTASLRRTSLRV